MRLVNILSVRNPFSFLNERGIVNAADIKKTVEILSNELRQYPDAVKWFQSQLYKHLINSVMDEDILQNVSLSIEYEPDPPEWMKREASKGELFKFNPKMNRRIKAEIRAVINWALEEFEGGRNPFRRGMTWNQAVVKASELRKRKYREKAMKAGTKTIISYPDGFKWVQLTSDNCIKWEGDEMQNCLRKSDQRGVYYAVFSLRDSSDKSYATLAVENLESEDYPNLEITDLQGRHGRYVTMEYSKYLIDFFHKTGYSVEDNSLWELFVPLGIFRNEENYDMNMINSSNTTVIEETGHKGWKWVITDEEIETNLRYALVDEKRKLILWLTIDYDEPEVVRDIVFGRSLEDNKEEALSLLANFIEARELMLMKTDYAHYEMEKRGLENNPDNVVG